jgi:two-component system, OmpR family, heavy metal sensor histidine kinase CusS
MRSIRLSLIVYFLLLLLLALGGVSVFTYQTARAALRDKVQTTRERLKARREERKRTLNEEVDNHLRRRAMTLGKMAESDFGGRRYLEIATAIRVGAGTAPLAPLGVGLWSSNSLLGPQWWLAQTVAHMPFVQPDNAEAVIAQAGEEHATEYFQSYNEHGTPVQRSQTLGDHEFTLDPAVRAKFDILEWASDDTELSPEVHLRRITLKYPVLRRPPGPPGRYLPPVFRPPGPGASSRGPSANPSPKGREEPKNSARPSGSSGGTGAARQRVQRDGPMVFIQCAMDTRERDQALAGFDEDLAHDLESLESESAASLSSLRNRLLVIGLGTFGAAIAGCCLLVGLGLLPLQRLSEAVSRVSAKDFRLQFDEPHLPRELEPIVGRLTETLDQLRRAFAREKQAAADISHELRTPLAALMTTIELALRKPRSPEDYRELLEDCHTTGQQMSQLVERLLALARLDARVDTLRMREVDAGALTDQCAALVRPLAEARGLTLQVHRHGPAPLAADPDKLREVVTNLLHNAIEYNRPDGRVEVKVERANGHLCLEVRDTGIGIAPEAREHIFERFYRADPARHAEGMHAGLGLAIVKGYVDLMGGRIRVESEQGVGSTFRVELPAAADDKVTR